VKNIIALGLLAPTINPLEKLEKRSEPVGSDKDSIEKELSLDARALTPR